MPIVYPMKTYGQLGLEMGITYAFLNEKFGFDFGERYHLDIEYKIKTKMDIDRAVFEVFGKIGLGRQEPVPRVSISPLGRYLCR